MTTCQTASDNIRAIIDKTIDDIKNQKLVSTVDVINVLLDIRIHLSLNDE